MKLSGSSIDSCGFASTQAHVGNSSLGATFTSGVVLGNKVHTTDDTGIATASSVGQNLDSVNGDLLGNTVCCAANGTSTVSAVTVTVSIFTVDKALDLRSSAAEFLFIKNVLELDILELVFIGHLLHGCHQHQCQ